MTAPVTVPPTLDERITDTFSVVSLLIAVVAGYLAAVWPIVIGLLNQSTPDNEYDRNELARRCRAYMHAAGVLAFASIAVIGVMAPFLCRIAVRAFCFHEMSPLRASVALFALFMVASTGVALVLATRLARRAKKLRKP